MPINPQSELGYLNMRRAEPFLTTWLGKNLSCRGLRRSPKSWYNGYAYNCRFKGIPKDRRKEWPREN